MEGVGSISVFATEKHFWNEDLVKTKLFIKVIQRTRAKLSITVENFKIYQLEELELPKV